MKIELELPDAYHNDRLVLCTQDNPTTIAYFNLYEDGDVWIKTKGCEGCPWENRQKCCSGCPMLSEKGCFFHLQSPKGSNKPFSCVTCPDPHPRNVLSWCQLEFECVKGKHKGQIRKLREDNPNLPNIRK